MSVNIYIGRDNVPEGIPFIFDVEPAVKAVAINGTEFERTVISELEHGCYKSKYMWTDRLGNNLYYDNISTGSKILFLLEICTDYIINCSELGNNAFEYLAMLDSYSMYLPSSRRAMPKFSDSSVVYINGVLIRR